MNHSRVFCAINRTLVRVGFALLFACAGCVATAGSPGQIGESRRLARGKQRGKIGEPSYTGTDKAITRHNLLANATFNDGVSLPWTVSFTAPGEGSAHIVDGALCLTVKNRGVNNWDAQLRHREMTIQRGHGYSVRYKAWATTPIKMRAKVGMQGPPYAEYWVDAVKLDTIPRTFSGSFTHRGPDDPTAEMTFHVGGNLSFGAPLPFDVCIDDVVLEDPRFVRADEKPADAPAALLVNQVGYFPGLSKIAIYRGTETSGVEWSLRDREGREVARGLAKVHGFDAPSGDHVQVIDFSHFTGTGTGFTLSVGGQRSHPFDIRPDLYQKLRWDALAFFYHNRSGVEIAMPFAGKPEWARPAGHTSDNKVPCWPGSGCDYSLDVSGGWYDAGDHGKYVVNAGISVWTLLNVWERAVHGKGNRKAFSDGTMNIPERNNGKPDLLDEVRFELEWMLKMQVPEGQKLAGMAHHKVHDKEWTALGLAPHEDPMARFLKPPSTAATLNLAAAAAQCARVWKGIDAEFAARCLSAAERAFSAAQAHPNLLAPPGGLGGGPYDDTHVDDEFYWAAAELYITTGKDSYRTFMQSSPFFLKVPVLMGNAAEAGMPTPFNWQETEGAGTISLALVPSGLDAKDVSQARAAVIAAADAYLDIAAARGYRVPIDYGRKNQAPWGSVSFLLNNMIVLALAYDFTGQRRYLDGVVLGMDYVLGRNAMDQSYVTGYGARPLQNPHHRFWAFQSNARYPKAPPGLVSGGPNSGLEDPYVQAAGLKGCAPEKCFVDHIEAWSTNEITINWNAPFAWVLAFLDEEGRAAPARNAERLPPAAQSSVASGRTTAPTRSKRKAP